MHGLQAVRPDGSSRRRARLRVARHDAAAARPSWWSLTVTVVVVMVMWAAGVVALPETYRRIVDLAGGIAVLVTLVAWVRRNGAALACEGEPHSHHDALAVRLVRSRRPPLPEVGGPEIRPVSGRSSSSGGHRPS